MYLISATHRPRARAPKQHAARTALNIGVLNVIFLRILYAVFVDFTVVLLTKSLCALLRDSVFINTYACVCFI
jgi:hypothetical protein